MVLLVAVTREAAEKAIRLYQRMTKSFRLIISIAMTKFMVAGCNITEEDRQPATVEGGTIDQVNQFQYLGAVISDNGQIDVEIDQRIANALKAF